MKINLKPNEKEDFTIVPYLLHIEIVTATIDAGSTFIIPVYVYHQGLEKSFGINLCGFEFKSDRPEKLAVKASQFLPRLVHLARLPSYMFIAREAGALYPVYTIGNEVFATAPGSPVFRHVELAKVREYLTDFLHEAGSLGENGLSDKLHVRGINMSTLGLRRPIFYLKKRVEGQFDFWAPVFESGDGRAIYTYAANERREVPVSGGDEVLRLRQVVAAALIADGRLADSYDLRPDRLFTPEWERLRQTLAERLPREVNGETIEIYENKEAVIAVAYRHDEGRYSLYLGEDETVVENRVTQDFARRGIHQASVR